MTMLNRLRLILKFQVMTRLLLARKRLYSFLRPDLEREKLMINLGGGLFFRPFWKVMDYVSPYYPFARQYIDYDIDLFSQPRLPLEDNAVAFYYSAHTLEHIPQEYCQNVFNEIYRTLKPGGAVRINVPDYDQIRDAADRGDAAYFYKQVGRGLSFEEAVIEQIATEYVGQENPDDLRAAYQSMSPEEFADHYTGMASRDVQIEKGGYHINWFHYDKMAAMLRDAGFSDIRKCRAQNSQFQELRGEGGPLALGDFFEIKRMLGMDTTHPDRSLYVEARK